MITTTNNNNPLSERQEKFKSSDFVCNITKESFKLVKKVIRADTDLSNPARKTILKLADQINRSFHTYDVNFGIIKQQSIAKAVKVSVRQIKYIIADLKKLGYIHVVKTKSKVNAYYIKRENFINSPLMPDATPLIAPDLPLKTADNSLQNKEVTESPISLLQEQSSNSLLMQSNKNKNGRFVNVTAKTPSKKRKEGIEITKHLSKLINEIPLTENEVLHLATEFEADKWQFISSIRHIWYTIHIDKQELSNPRGFFVTCLRGQNKRCQINFSYSTEYFTEPAIRKREEDKQKQIDTSEKENRNKEIEEARAKEEAEKNEMILKTVENLFEEKPEEAEKLKDKVIKTKDNRFGRSEEEFQKYFDEKYDPWYLVIIHKIYELMLSEFSESFSIFEDETGEIFFDPIEKDLNVDETKTHTKGGTPTDLSLCT